MLFGTHRCRNDLHVGRKSIAPAGRWGSTIEDRYSGLPKPDKGTEGAQRLRHLAPDHRRDMLIDIATVAILVACCVSVAVYHDLSRSFLASSDPDIVYVYNALLFNEGLPQKYIGHTGYVYFLILSGWFAALDGLGVIPISSYGELPRGSSFEPIYATLVYAGRWLSIFLVAGFALTFYYGLRWFTGHRLIAAATTILFVLSPGLLTQVLVMHTELPAVILVFAGTGALAYAVREDGLRAFVSLGLAAFLLTLAAMTKIQVVFLVLMVPALAYVLGKRQTGTVDPASTLFETIPFEVMIGFLLAFSVPAHVMIWTQIIGHDDEAAFYVAGNYQLAIACCLAVAIIAYGVIYQRSWPLAVLGLTVVSAGFSLATYVNFFHHSVQNTFVVGNFIEHMSKFSTVNVAAGISPAGSMDVYVAILDKIGSNISDALTRNILSAEFAKRPLTLVYQVVFVAIVIATIKRQWQLFFVAGTLFGIGFAMEVITSFRYWTDHYRIFSEPWALLAFAVVLDQVRKSEVFQAAYAKPPVRIVAAVVFSAGFLIVIGGELSFAFREREWYPPTHACGQAEAYMPELAGYFCKDLQGSG